jgi:hypothetical protein
MSREFFCLTSRCFRAEGLRCPAVRRSAGRGFWALFHRRAVFLSDLPFVDTFEAGVEKVVQGIENRANGLQGGEGLVPCDAAIADGFAGTSSPFFCST